MATISRTGPPKKQPGQGRGPRRIDGVVLDVRSGSLFLGFTQKKTRAMIARRLLPFRKVGGRLVLIKSELEHWLAALEGCTLEEAQNNTRIRQGVDV